MTRSFYSYLAFHKLRLPFSRQIVQDPGLTLCMTFSIKPFLSNQKAVALVLFKQHRRG